VDGSGNAYVSGSTSSTNFPTAGTPSQAATAGDYDAFVTKLGPGSARLYSTYLGGSGADGAAGIALDALGNIYVAGFTASADFPTAGTPSQAAYAGGYYDAFVTKLGPASERLLSTYLGGSNSDWARGIAVDPYGFIYVWGDTGSVDFPTGGNPIQTAVAGGYEAFVTRMDSTSARTYSTYLGGTGNDFARGAVVDGSGNAYIAGYTDSTDFPTAGTPFQPTLAGIEDTFVAKIFEPTPASRYFTLSPCRVVDTRDAPSGGPALAAGTDRVFTIAGACGVPATARAVSVNMAVTGATAAGNLRLYPAETTTPLVSSINYPAEQTRSNNAIISLNLAGKISVRCTQASGTAYFILDVSGYFE
jgi:hypothetical protein